MLDATLYLKNQNVSVNLTSLPLTDSAKQPIGVMLLLEDISSEKRMKSTMSRYMDSALAAKLMNEDSTLLGGKSIEATVLFSDIRSFH